MRDDDSSATETDDDGGGESMSVYDGLDMSTVQFLENIRSALHVSRSALRSLYELHDNSLDALVSAVHEE